MRALLPALLSLPLLLLAACPASAVLTMARSYPTLHGQLEGPGLDAPLTIHTDLWGVPHIRAETEHDLWYGIGYVHARDRLFQVDLMRRMGSGRMAEWFSEDEPQSIEYDAFIRSLGLDRKLQARLERSDPAILQVGAAYAAGINAGAANLPALPVEYRVLGVDFEPWSATDAMASTIINSWALNENAAGELVALLLADDLDAASLDALLRWDRTSPPVDAYWDQLRQARPGGLTAGFRGFLGFVWGVSVPAASNNWAIGPSRSVDGKPILANDPHLPQMVPSVWYVVEGKGGDVHVAGASLAGVPLISTGHNAHVAWGVTNTMADYVDLAVVERVGERGYRLAGEDKTLEQVDVSVPLKGGGVATRTVYRTEVGPVISELQGSHLVALRWSLLELEDHTADLVYRMQKARSVHDVLEVAGYPSMISQNLVLADTSGNIAWRVFGALPERRGYSGRVPYPASDPDYGWDGWQGLRPGLLNPPEGYLVTANGKPDHPAADAISTAYLPSHRRDRIAALIEARPKHSAATVQQDQLDQLDGQAAAALPALLQGLRPEGACEQALFDWDYEAGPESSGAAIYAYFVRTLIHRALDSRVPDADLALYMVATVPGRSVLDADLDHFLPDRPAAVAAALDTACAELEAALGPDVGAWQWGQIHRYSIRHPFSAGSAALASWDLARAPAGGSQNTVNAAGFDWKSMDAQWIASLRLVTPLGDPGAGTFIYPGGQSGHPGHDQSQALYEAFLRGEQRPLLFEDAEVLAKGVDTLVLDPVGPPAAWTGASTPTPIPVEIGDFNALIDPNRPAHTASMLAAMRPEVQRFGTPAQRALLDLRMGEAMVLGGDTVRGKVLLSRALATAQQHSLVEVAVEAEVLLMMTGVDVP